MTSTGQWTAPPDSWRIADGEVHVWRVSLDVTASVAARLAETFTDEERARAKRFRRDADARRFTVTRGALRAILAPYVGATPSALAFSDGPHGKPALTQSVSQSTRHSDVSFNVSHSGELALLAVGRGREVGIDIERMDAHTDMDALARRFLSEAERSCLASLEGPGRRAAFYRAWTSKEAYLKARGVGLSVPLDSFDVSFRPGAPPRLLASREVGAAVARWTLMELPTGPDYAAVLAIDGTPRTIRLWHWSPTTSSRERGSSSQYGAPADPA